MFGLSFGEIVIIAVLALLLLGPERLPEAAKTLGKGLRDFKKATDDLKGQIETEIYADERKAVRPALVPPVPSAPGARARPDRRPRRPPRTCPGSRRRWPSRPSPPRARPPALVEPPGAEPSAPQAADAGRAGRALAADGAGPTPAVMSPAAAGASRPS